MKIYKNRILTTNLLIRVILNPVSTEELTKFSICKTARLAMFALLTFRWFKLYIFAFFVLGSKSTMTIVVSSSLVLKLISPGFVPNSHENTNDTLIERIRRVDYSSMARYNYIQRSHLHTSKYDDIQSSLVPDENAIGFFVNFSIGEPPISMTVQIDTGSELLWIPCYPCKNCPPKSNLAYDPAKSSTFSQISCDSRYCPNFGHCSLTRSCAYEVGYEDHSFTKGEVAREQLKFSTSDDGITSISDIVFGCGYENDGIGTENGIMGLGSNPLSLVTQLGSKFSYCIGSLRDRNYEYNHLVIGEDAKMEGYSTPIKTFGGHYYLTLEGISVGDTRLDIDPKIFKKQSTWDDMGVIIDSGATFSYLARSAYNPLIEEVQRLVGGLLRKVTVSSAREKICYMGSVPEDVKGFPVVTFHFAGEADLVVDAEGMFKQYPADCFCLAVVPVADSQVNVIGLMAQQYYNFGYDLKSMTLYFQRIDCELLED